MSKLRVAPSNANYFIRNSSYAVANNPHAQYAKHVLDYVDDFYLLLSEWREETEFCSSLSEIVEHSSFKNIIKLGRKIVPLIIEEIKNEPSLLVLTLPRIMAGEDPVDEKDWGNIPAMTKAWINELEHHPE